MADISKISPDDGSTILNIKDSNAVHYGDQSKGYVGKNLFPPYSPYGLSINGISLTWNKDGTFTANGTATANVFFSLYHIDNEDGYKFKTNTYRLSGCPLGGSGSNYSMKIQNLNNSSEQYDDFGSGVDVTCNGTDKYKVYIIIRNGYHADNLVFKPMLTFAGVPNSDYAHYEPYLTPNTDLMSYVDNTILGAVNLFILTQTNGTVDDITYTVNSDNSFSTSGISNADARNEIGKVTLPAGTYHISGNTATAYSRGIRIRVTNKSDDSAIAWDDGSGATFTLSQTTDILIGLRYGNNVSFNDLSFSIMIVLPSYTGGYVPGAMTNKELTEMINDKSDDMCKPGNHSITGIFAFITPSNGKLPEFFLPWNNPNKKPITFANDIKIYERGSAWTELSQSQAPYVYTIRENGFYIGFNLTNALQSNTSFTLKVEGTIIFS